MTNPPRLRPVAGLRLALLFSLLHAAEPTPARSNETITLPKFVVKGNAVCSYGIGLAAGWNDKIQCVS